MKVDLKDSGIIIDAGDLGVVGYCLLAFCSLDTLRLKLVLVTILAATLFGTPEVASCKMRLSGSFDARAAFNSFSLNLSSPILIGSGTC